MSKHCNQNVEPLPYSSLVSFPAVWRVRDGANVQRGSERALAQEHGAAVVAGQPVGHCEGHDHAATQWCTALRWSRAALARSSTGASGGAAAQWEGGGRRKEVRARIWVRSKGCLK